MAYYRKDMLSIKSRSIMAQLFAEIVLLSESLEAYRETLAQIPHFDCISLFRFIDQDQKGFIREKDIHKIVGTKHRKLLTYAFSWLDNLKIGEISRLEFAAFLLPKDNNNLRELVAIRMQSPELIDPHNETLLEQVQVFQQMILEITKRQMRLIELRRQLIECPDYSLKGAVLSIDINYHQWLCADDIWKFMKNYGLDVNLRQTEKLVETINCTLNGKITSEQLKWTIEGFEAKDKSYLDKIKKANRKPVEQKGLGRRVGDQQNYEQPKQKPLTSEREVQTKEVDGKKKRQDTSQPKIQKLISFASEPVPEYQIIAKKLALIQQQAQQTESKLLLQEKQMLKQNQMIYQKQLSNIKAKKQGIQNLQQIQIASRRIRQSAEESAKLDAQEQLRRKNADKLQVMYNKERSYSNDSYWRSSFRYPIRQEDSVLPQFGSNKYVYNSEMTRNFSQNQYSSKAFFKETQNKDNLREQSRQRKSVEHSSVLSSTLFNRSRQLNEAQQLREQIRRERAIEREIQSKFGKNQLYDLSQGFRTAQNKELSQKRIPKYNYRDSYYQSPLPNRNGVISKFNTVSTNKLWS